MSRQHLFKFQKEEDYNIAKKNHLVVPNISSIVETGNTYVNPKFSTRETADAGDIIVFHETEKGETIVKFMKPEAFDKNDNYWTADSIVVVPSSHTKDGTVRAMALNCASVNNPNEGSEAETIAWGNKPNNDMTTFGRFIVFSQINAQGIEDSFGSNTEGIMPTDANEQNENSVLNPYDTETYYLENAVGSIISSPYNNDGSKSNAYHSIGNFSEFINNPLKDMDGEENTFMLLTTLNPQYLSQTLYAQELVNENTMFVEETVMVSLVPGASACVRYGSSLKPYSFDETKNVEENRENINWYLPSAGEMGYLLSRIGKIDYALSQVGKTSLFERVNGVLGTSTIADPQKNTKGRISENYSIVAFNLNGYASIVGIHSDNFICVPFCKY